MEADITQRVHAAGLPAPGTDGVVDVDGRPGIVFERIRGESMWERMRDAPHELPGLLHQLVNLQVTFNEAPAIDGLPELTPRLQAKIETARGLPQRERELALQLLARLPTSSALCHGDMHPANILLTERGPIAVDWYDAGAGHPAADYARSALLMMPPSSASPSESHLGGATHETLVRLYELYLSALKARDLVDAGLFEDWRAAMAVVRLGEPVPADDMLMVWASWRATASTS